MLGLRKALTRKEYDEWMGVHGYNDRNDWNFQENGRVLIYWIRNETTGLFALVEESGYGKFGSRYEILVAGFNDFGCFTKTT